MLLTIGPNNSTGFRKHLEELSNLVEEGKFIAVDEKDAKMTLPKIIRFQPTLTIIGGKNWIKRIKKILKKIPGAKGILYTSPLAQAEISGDEIKNLKIYRSNSSSFVKVSINGNDYTYGFIFIWHNESPLFLILAHRTNILFSYHHRDHFLLIQALDQRYQIF